MQVYVDGHFVPAEEARISVFDHGFLYGDGVFEGIRVYESRYHQAAGGSWRSRQPPQRRGHGCRDKSERRTVPPCAPPRS